MSKELSTNASVTIAFADEVTWPVNRQKPATRMITVAFPNIESLADDVEWEKIEARIVAHHNRNLPPFEE
jgi:hypothetical protein